jgi:hypothetical protein
MNRPYGIQLIDDLHTYFPAILYNPEQFTSTQGLLQYVQRQVRTHTDIFTRNRTAFHESSAHQSTPSPLRTPPSIIRTSHQNDRLDLAPIFAEMLYPPRTSTEEELHIQYPPYNTRINNSLNTLSNTILLTELFNTIQTIQSPQPIQIPQTPVLVRPSLEQITTATVLRQANDTDDESQCSICQDTYTEGQAIRTIQHCHHSFHKNCIDPWFQRNVRCPVCRYDIRDYRVQEEP